MSSYCEQIPRSEGLPPTKQRRWRQQPAKIVGCSSNEQIDRKGNDKNEQQNRGNLHWVQPGSARDNWFMVPVYTVGVPVGLRNALSNHRLCRQSLPQRLANRILRKRLLDNIKDLPRCSFSDQVVRPITRNQDDGCATSRTANPFRY